MFLDIGYYGGPGFPTSNDLRHPSRRFSLVSSLPIGHVSWFIDWVGRTAKQILTLKWSSFIYLKPWSIQIEAVLQHLNWSQDRWSFVEADESQIGLREFKRVQYQLERRTRLELGELHAIDRNRPGFMSQCYLFHKHCELASTSTIRMADHKRSSQRSTQSRNLERPGKSAHLPFKNQLCAHSFFIPCFFFLPWSTHAYATHMYVLSSTLFEILIFYPYWHPSL